MAKKSFRKNLFDQMLSAPAVPEKEVSTADDSASSLGIGSSSGEIHRFPIDTEDIRSAKQESGKAEIQKADNTDKRNSSKTDIQNIGQTEKQKPIKADKRIDGQTDIQKSVLPANQDSSITDVRLSVLPYIQHSPQTDFRNNAYPPIQTPVLPASGYSVCPPGRTDGQTDIRQDVSSAPPLPPATPGSYELADNVSPGKDNLCRTKVTYWIRSSLAKRLKYLSVDQDRLLSDLVSEALSDLLMKYNR